MYDVSARKNLIPALEAAIAKVHASHVCRKSINVKQEINFFRLHLIGSSILINFRHNQ